MNLKNLTLFLIFTIFISCNFESAEEAASGGGLFNNNTLVENSFLMSPPVNKIYIENENIDLIFTHPYNLTVTGIPQINLDIGGNLVTADYLTGNGTQNLTFRYTVVSNDLDLNGISFDGAISLNGGTIQFNQSGVTTNADVSSVISTSTSGVLVDAQAPNIVLITPPIPDIYFINEQLTFTVMFDELVNINGSPSLEINIGGFTKEATYLSGSGSSMVIFTYTVGASDIDLDGITMISPVKLNGGTINDFAGNQSDLTFIPTPMFTTFVNGDGPTIDSLTLPSNNTYRLGDVISIDVNYNEVVNVSGGIPYIDLDINGTTVQANYSNGSGTNTLNFKYIVTQGLYDNNGIRLANTISLNGSLIQDSTFIDARVELNSPLTPQVLVDSRLPQVVTVNAPADGNYVTGNNLDFTFEFNEAVTVINSPYIELQLATGNVLLNYESGSGSTVLTFRHIVTPADMDNDGLNFSTSLIDLNTTGIINGVITGNNADLNFIGNEPVMTNITVNESPQTQLAIVTQPIDTYKDSTISPPITVEIRDASNNLVPAATDNVTISFGNDPTLGVATLSGTLTVPAVGGVATFNDLAIDTIDSGYTFTVSSGSLATDTSNSFDITQAPATQVAFTQDPTNSLAGSNISPDITVELRDASGNIVPTANDNITISLGTDPSAGDATLSGTTTVAAVNGIATFNDITIDKAFNGYTLVASSGILTDGTSSTFDISPDIKAQLAFVVQPVDTEFSVNISPSIEVEIQDAYGNKTTDTDTITIAFNTDPSAGSATLGGTLSQNAVNGLATFNDINVDTVGSLYSFTVTSIGLTSSISNNFDILPGAPTQLVITQEPTNTIVDSNITPSLTVELRDASNNLVTNASDTISLSLSTDPSAGSANIGGLTTKAAVNGVVTFDDIQIDTVNNGYVFEFNSGVLPAVNSTSFDIEPAVPTQLVIVSQPINSVAGEVFSPNITVEIRDALNNIVPTATDAVTLSIGTDPSSATANLGGTVTVNAVAGIATFNDLNIDKAFIGYDLIASSGSLTNSTSASFNITPAAKSQLAFSVEPSDTEYLSTVSPNIEVEIQDAFGNKTADTDSITLSINNNPSGASLTGTSTQSAINGTAIFSDISLDQVGNGYTLDASAIGLASSTSSAFNIDSTATQLVITQEPTNTNNGFTITPSITIEVRDASNNLVTDSTANITVSINNDPSGSATLNGTLTVAAVAGIAIFNDLNIDNVASGYTLDFSSIGLTSSTSASFDILQAPATQLAFSQSPSNSVAGEILSPDITVEIQDANGNLVSTATDNVTLAFDTDPSLGVAIISGTTTVSAINGVATFSDITIDKAFNSYTLVATSVGLSSATSSLFNISAAAKSQLSFSVQPSNTEYLSNISPSITVDILDAFGNKTNDTDTITLAINNNPTGANLAGTITQSAINGTATFNDINFDQVGSGFTLDANAIGITSATSSSFDVIAVPTQIVIIQQPSNTDNGSVISPNITVELRDASNNLVLNSTNPVTISFNTDPTSSATITGTVTVAAINGVANFTDISIDNVAVGYSLELTSAGLISATTSLFDITQSPPSQLVFLQDPLDATAGESIAPNITVEIQDANGSLVPNATNSITLSIGTDPSSGSASLGGTVTVAAISGVATFSDITLDKAFNSYTLSANAAGLTIAASNPFNISPATKSQLAIVTQPINTGYGESISPAIDVEIQDIYGNKTTDTDSITLSINSNPGGSTLSGTTTISAVSGVASFSDISLDQTGISYTLDANATGLSSATTDTFDIIATPTQLVITNQPVNTDNASTISSITVEIRDAANTLVSDSTANVTLTFSNDPSAGSANIIGTTTVSAINGIATFNDISIDTVASGYTLEFTSAGLSSVISSSFDITQAPATQLSFTQNPNNVTAGEVNSPDITVELQDSNGNIDTTATNSVTLSFSTDPSLGAATIGGSVTVNAVAGIATFSDITIDKAFNAYSLEATSVGLTSSTSTYFNVSPAAKSQLAIVTEPSDTPYGDSISPSIEVEIQDAFGNKTTDTDAIILSINNNPGGSKLTGTVSQNAVNGTATFNDISLDQVGSGYTLDTTAPGLTSATSLAFDITTTPTQLVITQEPTNSTNSDQISPSLTVEIRDALNNLVTDSTANVTIQLNNDPSAGNANLTGTLTVAAVAGVATFSDIQIDYVQSGYTLDFTSPGLTSATSTSFNITQAPATQLVFLQNPINSIAGVVNSPNITVELQDSSGNVVTTATDTVTISLDTDPSSGTSTLGGTLSVSAVSGVATFNDITLDKAFNAYTLQASAVGLSSATSTSFNISPAAKAQLAFSIEPNNTSYDSNIAPAVEVEIQDAFGNKTNDTDNITISIGSDPSGSTANLSGTLTVSAVVGTAIFSDINIDTNAIGYTLNANAAGLSQAVSSSFDIIAGAPTQLVITNQPTNTLFNSNISPSITVEIRDIQNNLVTNATNNISISFGTDPSSGAASLSGTLTRAAVGGIASFNDLSIDTENNGYTLNVTAGGLTSDSTNLFNILGYATLSFTPNTAYDYGSVSLGDTKDQTYLITHTGGPATGVGETTLTTPFAFKGGSFPGTGGTCASTVSNSCTVVVSYTPTAAITSNETMTIVYNDGASIQNITKSLSGSGLNSTPTSINVNGPNAVITNNCVPYSVRSKDDNGNIVNVSSNETVSLVINNGTGNFYSDSACTTTTTSTTILSGTSSTDIYFRTNTPAQNLTLIFNASTLENTSRAVTSSNEPVSIVANISPEIITDTCTQGEVSLVDTNGVKTGASSAQVINIATSGSEQVYNDAFCTGLITQLNFSQYEGTKYVYIKNNSVESSTISFTDNAATLNSDSSNINFVAALTWWNANYNKRIKISLNNLDQSSTFNDIPILVKIDSSKLNYADLQANGNDIRFTLDDQTTTLSYSIDTWNTSGESFIWVKIPTMLASSEMDIYMYYSYSSAANGEDNANVWNNYEGVWQMNKSGANYIDETGSGKTGTPSGAGVTDVSGPIGNAVNFDGASTLTVNYDLALTLGTTSTLSFWLKTAQVGNATDWRAPGITGMSGTAASQDLFYGYIKNTGVIGSSAGGGTQVESNFVVNDNTWRYITVSRNESSGEFRYYVNGVLNGTGSSGTGFKNRSFFDFGATTQAWGGGGFIYLEGAMDSIRMSAGLLSDARVKAEYKFTTNTNITYSAVENQ